MGSHSCTADEPARVTYRPSRSRHLGCSCLPQHRALQQPDPCLWGQLGRLSAATTKNGITISSFTPFTGDSGPLPGSPCKCTTVLRCIVLPFIWPTFQSAAFCHRLSVFTLLYKEEPVSRGGGCSGHQLCLPHLLTMCPCAPLSDCSSSCDSVQVPGFNGECFRDNDGSKSCILNLLCPLAVFDLLGPIGDFLTAAAAIGIPDSCTQGG